MSYLSWSKLGVLSLAVLVGITDSANAGWGWFAGSGGSYGGYGSYGGSWGSRGGGSWGGGSWGGGSWGGSGGSWGSRGGWGSGGGMFARRASWGSGGSYGGSYGGGSWGGYRRVSYASYGSYGGGSWGGASYSYASYGGSAGYPVSHGSVGSYATSTVVSAPAVVYSQPAVVETTTNDCCSTGTVDGGVENYSPAYPVEAPMEAVPNEPAAAGGSDDSEAMVPSDSALLAVNVPSDARVYVNGYQTRSAGNNRRFLSSGLRPNRDYSYTVKAVMNLDGREVTETKTVSLHGGQRQLLVFGNSRTDAPETTVTLIVPENAKVNLSGSDTKMTGTKRVFATRRLSKGQVWENYVVQVSWEAEGRTISKERKLRIVGGETYEIRIDDDSSLASL